MSAEWIVELKFTLHADVAKRYCNILHITQNGNKDVYGDRNPAFFYDKYTGKLLIHSAVNGDRFSSTSREISFNTEYTVQVHQRYKSGGVYKYSVILNGVEIHSMDNTQASQFFNVKVWAGTPWELSCNGWIKDVKITNFL